MSNKSFFLQIRDAAFFVAGSILMLCCANVQAVEPTPPAPKPSGNVLNVESSPILQKIKKTKTIVVGVRETVAPFSFNNGKDQYIGYSVEICEDIIRSLRVDLGLDRLRVVYLPVTSKDRLEVVEAGNVDMECGATANTQERQRRVNFAHAHFFSKSYFVGEKGKKLKNFTQLKNARVAVATKTIQEKLLNEINQAQGLNMKITSYKDPSEAFLAVLGKNADFTPMDDLFLLDMMLNVSGAKDSLEFYQELSFLPNTYGIMLPKTDPVWTEVFNKYLDGVLSGSKIEKIYKKWLLSPVPPKGNSVNWAVPAELRKLFEKPSSVPLL